MKKACGYCRVSTSEQAKEGVSLENQRRKIAIYADLNDLDLVEIVADEGKSGKDLNRPGVQRVLEMARRKEVDAVIVYKLDRLFRSTTDALQTAKMLDSRGVALHSINEKLDTQSAMGKFFFTLTASLAEMERNIISERTADAMAAKKAKGERVGEIPYGYDLADDGVHLVENGREQSLIGKMKRMRGSGNTYKEIAKALNKSGSRTRCGSLWRLEYVARMIYANQSKSA